MLPAGREWIRRQLRTLYPSDAQNGTILVGCAGCLQLWGKFWRENQHHLACSITLLTIARFWDSCNRRHLQPWGSLSYSCTSWRALIHRVWGRHREALHILEEAICKDRWKTSYERRAFRYFCILRIGRGSWICAVMEVDVPQEVFALFQMQPNWFIPLLHSTHLHVN